MPGLLLKKFSPVVFSVGQATPHLWAPALTPHLGAITKLNERLLYTPTRNVWGPVRERSRFSYTFLYRCACKRKWEDISWKEVKTLLMNTTPSDWSLFIVHTNYIAWTLGLFNVSFPPLSPSLPRLNILQTDRRWATAPSTSSTGWTGASWQWGWSTSCPPACPLSICTITQTLPHCHWAPTLLSGQLLGVESATSSCFSVYR